jgi:hypothetical protein
LRQALVFDFAPWVLKRKPDIGMNMFIKGGQLGERFVIVDG